jgi:hypothetical protein
LGIFFSKSLKTLKIIKIFSSFKKKCYKFLKTIVRTRTDNLIYKSNSGGVCLSVRAVPGRFFQSLPVPCGASPDVTSPDVTDSREKRNQGQSDFLRQKI